MGRFFPLAAVLSLLIAGAPGAKAADPVVFAGPGGTIEQFMRNVALPAFEKATGSKVTYVVGTALGNYSKIAAMRDRPEIDVNWSNDLTHIAGKQSGLWDRLDPAVVTNLPQVMMVARDPDDVGVGENISSLGIEYNTEAFAKAGWAPPTSWFDLWDPKYKGRIALYSIDILYSQDFMGAITRLMGGNESHIDPGVAKLRTLFASGNIATVPNTPAEMDNVLAQGQAWVAVNAGLRALVMRAHGAPMGFVLPKEGGVLFRIDLDLVKGAPHKLAAERFINFLIGADMQTKQAAELFWAPINRNAQFPAAMHGLVPEGEAGMASLIQLDRPTMSAHLDDWIDRWNREIETAK